MLTRFEQTIFVYVAVLRGRRSVCVIDLDLTSQGYKYSGNPGNSFRKKWNDQRLACRGFARVSSHII
ncbi:hypothetical protein TNCV_4857851, partial [Trichonephila clavipes]